MPPTVHNDDVGHRLLVVYYLSKRWRLHRSRFRTIHTQRQMRTPLTGSRKNANLGHTSTQINTSQKTTSLIVLTIQQLEWREYLLDILIR